jgi:sugar phosphate isomerase/epimerase
MKPPVSIQLFSFRDVVGDDFEAALAQAVACGYRAVETAGWGNLNIKQVAQTVQQTGVHVSGLHVRWDELTPCPELIAHYALMLDAREIIISWAPPSLLATQQGCETLGARMAAIGEQLAAYGLRLSYHNHGSELALVEGRPAIEWILQLAQPTHLSWQADVHWVKEGGQDPITYLAKLGQRCPLLHLRDSAAFGQGNIDFAALLKTIESVGIAEWLVVEQAAESANPVEDARANRAFLRDLGYDD